MSIIEKLVYLINQNAITIDNVAPKFLKEVKASLGIEDEPVDEVLFNKEISDSNTKGK